MSPIVVGSERQFKPFVRYSKIAVATDGDRIRSYGSDFLRNQSDIGLLAAVGAPECGSSLSPAGEPSPPPERMPAAGLK